MRLIDADAFKDNFKAKTGIGRTMRNIIDEQPTAYDVDKVVERLEDKALEHAMNGQQFGEDGFFSHEEEEQAIKQGIEEAVEIVKSGAISHPDSTHTDTGNDCIHKRTGGSRTWIR